MKKGEMNILLLAQRAIYIFRVGLVLFFQTAASCVYSSVCFVIFFLDNLNTRVVRYECWRWCIFTTKWTIKGDKAKVHWINLALKLFSYTAIQYFWFLHHLNPFSYHQKKIFILFVQVIHYLKCALIVFYILWAWLVYFMMIKQTKIRH